MITIHSPAQSTQQRNNLAANLLPMLLLSTISFATQAKQAVNDITEYDGITSATQLDSLLESGRGIHFSRSQYFAGGKTGTVFNTTSRAFEQPAPAIANSVELLQRFSDGEALFEASYVTDPNVPFGGLGPVYNKNSCISCHPAYGRSRQTKRFSSGYGNGYIALVHTAEGKIVDGYKFMLQTKATPPYKPNAQGVDITWHNFVDRYNNHYPDGTPYNDGNKYEGTLIYPTAQIVNPMFPLPEGARVSIEGTIGLYGTGLLDAIKDEDIIAEYDFQQQMPGPIKGQHGRWITEKYDGKKHLAKFTWHTTRSSLQNGPGFNGSHSVGNITRADRPSLFTTEKWIQAQEKSGLNVDKLRATQPIEMSLESRDNLMLWSRSLAVPAARNLEDPTVQKGQAIFHNIGCSRCHKPDWTTGDYEYIPGFSKQRIWPYTDMLRHDMGEENRGMTLTYRTPPLWARALMFNVVDHTDMFHDLRARNFEEAILWHFGEGNGSREQFRKLTKEQRLALVKFLEAI